MTKPDAPLAIVDKWWAKSVIFSSDSDDALLSLMTKTFETIAVALSPASNIQNITRCVSILDRERSCALLSENNEFNVHRLLTFGLIESLQIALLELSEKSSGEKEPILFDEVSNLSTHSFTENIDPLDSLIDDLQSQMSRKSNRDKESTLSDQPQMSRKSSGDKESTLSDQPQMTRKSSGDNESTLSDQNPILPDPPIMKNEPMDDTYEDFQLSSDEDATMEDESTSENEKEAAQSGDEATRNDEHDPLMENPPKKKRNRKRKGSKFAYSWIDTDHDYCMRMSRGRSKPKSNAAIKPMKLNPTELKCTECDYATQLVSGWIRHLRVEHFTTPVLAGLALRCECGNEAQSDAHFRKCEVGNITVVKRGGGPLKRLSDLKETPQCCLCSAFPISVGGYYWHLQNYHKSTLRLNGVYVKCACGFRIYSYTRAVLGHNKKCDGRRYSLHSLDEK